ncbi:hypothetical protein QQ73_05680, partial [Candidatus Endoriftia persephone str. Guaymas]|nr:hypothetical protein [Candidatus Endoriftia persephone str. Guaymas]
MILIAVFNIILSVALVIMVGFIGVAISTMVSVIMWNAICLFYVKKKLGFWMIGYPSLNLSYNT